MYYTAYRTRGAHTHEETALPVSKQLALTVELDQCECRRTRVTRTNLYFSAYDPRLVAEASNKNFGRLFVEPSGFSVSFV